MRGPQHDRLSVFVGHWHTTGRTTDPDAPILDIDARDTYEWLPGGYFVLHTWNSRIGTEPSAGIEIISYDANTLGYRTQFYDNSGQSGSEQLTVINTTWTWLGKDVMGVRWHRCIAEVAADGNTITALHEKSEDGRTWTAWMTVTLRREAGAQPNSNAAAR